MISVDIMVSGVRPLWSFLQNTDPLDNITLTKSIQSYLQNIFNLGGRVTFNWIPSHTDLYGNEQADIAAKQAAHKDVIDFNQIPSSISALKKHIKLSIGNKSQPTEAEITNSNSLTWSLLANKTPIDITKLKINRKQETSLLKLKLGYPNFEHIKNNDNWINCKYCKDILSEPFYHYITECPFTAGVFLKQAKGLPAHGVLFKDRMEHAATLFDLTIKHALPHLLNVIKRFPMPR